MAKIVTADEAVAKIPDGATVLVAGTAVFEHPLGVRAGVSALRRALLVVPMPS